MSKAYVSFSAKCYAIYQSSLELPKKFMDKDGNITATKKEILDYIRNHLPEASVKKIDFQDDLENVTESVWEEDIQNIWVEKE